MYFVIDNFTFNTSIKGCILSLQYTTVGIYRKNFLGVPLLTMLPFNTNKVILLVYNIHWTWHMCAI